MLNKIQKHQKIEKVKNLFKMIINPNFQMIGNFLKIILKKKLKNLFIHLNKSQDK